MSESQYLEMNRDGWDLRTEAHFESDFYDVDGFLAGNTSLREIEQAELCDVRGKRLLHLQCHFGLDTLSWTREGAICTGVDLSPAAIGRAKELAIRAGLEAEFICSDICAFERSGSQPYDIVFTSYGAVCWISDLERWADIISTNLAIGGTFYMAEFHPVYDLLAGYSYFSRLEPDVEEEASYTENASEIVAEFAVWAHPFTDVVNALIGAGIRIDRLNEFPFSPYNCFEGLEEREPGRFYLAHGGHDAPLVYSVTGTKIA